jgi:hypothetical protein
MSDTKTKIKTLFTGETIWNFLPKITLASVFVILTLTVAGITLPVWLPLMAMAAAGMFESVALLKNLRQWFIDCKKDWKNSKNLNTLQKFWFTVEKPLRLLTDVAPLFAFAGCVLFAVSTALTAGTSAAIAIGIAIPSCFVAAFTLSALSIMVKLPRITLSDEWKNAKTKTEKFKIFCKKCPTEMIALGACVISAGIVATALLLPAASVVIPAATVVCPVLLGVAAATWGLMSIFPAIKKGVTSLFSKIKNLFAKSKRKNNPNNLKSDNQKQSKSKNKKTEKQQENNEIKPQEKNIKTKMMFFKKQRGQNNPPPSQKVLKCNIL